MRYQAATQANVNRRPQSALPNPQPRTPKPSHRLRRALQHLKNANNNLGRRAARRARADRRPRLQDAAHQPRVVAALLGEGGVDRRRPPPLRDQRAQPRDAAAVRPVAGGAERRQL